MLLFQTAENAEVLQNIAESSLCLKFACRVIVFMLKIDNEECHFSKKKLAYHKYIYFSKHFWLSESESCLSNNWQIVSGIRHQKMGISENMKTGFLKKLGFPEEGFRNQVFRNPVFSSDDENDKRTAFRGDPVRELEIEYSVTASSGRYLAIIFFMFMRLPLCLFLFPVLLCEPSVFRTKNFGCLKTGICHSGRKCREPAGFLSLPTRKPLFVLYSGETYKTCHSGQDVGSRFFPGLC